MSFMQEMGIVHRDLKSSNILLESIHVGDKKSILRAVVCDFGLAKVTNKAIAVEGQKFREIGGFSPRYAAPEVLASVALGVMNDAEIDKKSDVYSFAIIIWELLTRQTPWDKLTREEITFRVQSGLRVSVLRPLPCSLPPLSPSSLPLLSDSSSFSLFLLFLCHPAGASRQEAG